MELKETIQRRSKKANTVYDGMVEDLKKQIGQGEYSCGYRFPSETELARRYSISRMSVRQGLARLQNQGMLVKVNGKGSFVSQKHLFKNTAVERTTTKTISLIVTTLEDPFVAKIHSGVVEELRDTGYNVCIYSSERVADQEAANIHQSVERGCAGLIIFPIWGRTNAKQIEELDNNGIPVVLVDRTLPDLNVDYVATDNFRGGMMAVDYLIQMGHRRIGMIKGISGTANDDRYRGYCHSLQKHGITYDESLVVVQEYIDPSQEPLGGGQHEMRRLMELPDRPSAVFAVNDTLAFGAETAALEMGLKVPGDVSIIGFDNFLQARLAPIPLTTIHQPCTEIGRAAAKLVLENIKAMAIGPKPRVQQIQFIPQLVVRQSVQEINNSEESLS
jgi:DNA-binding LacI/PurR family transcriptional regulator